MIGRIATWPLSGPVDPYPNWLLDIDARYPNGRSARSTEAWKLLGSSLEVFVAALGRVPAGGRLFKTNLQKVTMGLPDSLTLLLMKSQLFSLRLSQTNPHVEKRLAFYTGMQGDPT